MAIWRSEGATVSRIAGDICSTLAALFLVAGIRSLAKSHVGTGRRDG
jgi:hypothetical protein